MTVSQQATVPLAAAGQRFDQVLAALFPAYSRSRLADWIKRGQATLDGRSVPPRTRVHGGERVALAAALETETPDRAEPIALSIVHEDAHLLVIDKPAGLVVHPGAGNRDGTLLNALLHHAPQLAALPRAGIVHRLDKDTSGLLVVAKTLPAHTALVAMLERHAVERRYAAVVEGVLIAGGTVTAPLGRHPVDRLRRAVREDDGKPAVTHYRLRERFPAHTYIACQLETGRTHQIRVHMAHIHHPLVGDPLYGGGLRLPRGAGAALAAALRGFRRQALHAEQLAFVHPLTGQALAFQAPLPADFQGLLAALRADAAGADR
ncbi:MAG: 23S rRNA pseudouridine(1911/1915/1917) synthase RluD [Fulvimonas sp.]|nr:23S rRNA pseudouridine(1911/1915/1917) synthase RluD [Fulvimonas sp.]